jgi:hypothetical protein
MTVPTNTFDAYTAKGIREDLSDIIYRIDPVEVPFTSNIGRNKATAKLHEWQIQTLAAAVDTNAQIEGDDATANVAVPTVRVGNRTQISAKTAIVSGTLEAVNKAGRDSEMEYQVLLKGLEIRRDVEKQMLSNKASVIGVTLTTAAQSAGIESWFTTNVSRGAGGASGGFQVGTGLVNAPTDGTQRAFTEALLKTVHQAVYTAGGRPNSLYMHPTQKVVFSAFAGIAVNRINQPSSTTSQATIIGGADTYVGDFGNLTAVIDIFMRNRSAILVDPKFWKMSNLRPIKNWELAKTGDSMKRQILQEYCLEADNEASSGIVADLT